MASNIKNVKLIRSEAYGYGFSILGGAGSELPPIVYDIIDGSPASKASELSQGDIIWEINGKEVLSCTTKEVLNYLRLSPKEVQLKLKTDSGIQEKIKNLKKDPYNPETLRTAITKQDLIGVREIVAKKSEPHEAKLPTSATSCHTVTYERRVEVNGKTDESYKSISKNEDFEKNFYGKDVHNPEKKPKSNIHLGTGELTLNFSEASNDSRSLPSQRELISLKEFGSCSMPSSPLDRDTGGIGQTTTQNWGSPQSLCSPVSTANTCGSFVYPHNTTAVRISKSEDYLQYPKDTMSSVNIELDDDVTASLNTLLDTRDDLPVCTSLTPTNPSVVNSYIKNDDLDLSALWTVNTPITSSPESCGQSSHDSDSPLIHSPSQASPQSPSSSMQYSCSGGIYDKIYSGRDSVASSNHSENVCSNSSSLTSPDTDVPDELEWDDTTPTFSPTNHIANGFSERSRILNGHSVNVSSSTDSSNSDKVSNKLDENRIVIKVAGPGKLTQNMSHTYKHMCRLNAHPENVSINGDPDKTPTNTPPHTPGSGTLSPETLAYQQLWESEEETCISEKSDDNSCSAVAKPVTHRAPCASSPPMSEDESDIESLHSFHFSPKAVDVPSVIRLAKRLFMLDGFKKSDVSRHLSKNNEFSKAVAEEYLHYFDFRGDTLDIALRKFLDRFCLAGETQDRERVLVHFSRWYLDCNPGTFNSQDAVHTLTCALMLLNTDLHNENIGRKMTCVEFIDNLAELNDGENFSSDVLKFLYESIKKLPLKWAADDDQVDGTVRVKNGRRQIDEGSLIIGSNPFLTAPMGSGVIYKKGYIMRKCCIEPNGKKTAFGKRSWKMWFCVIQDLALYLHKDEQGARKGPPPQLGQNAVRLHHALAVKAHDYLKKEHVFRLQTADQAEYLLQTSDRKELQAWIDAINFVASSLSAPPMPGAVGSQHKFQRPLLPCSITKLNIVEQLEDHTRRLAQLEKELDSHRNNPPDKNAKSATVSNYKEKETYLVYELKRYQTYVSLLRSRLNPTRSGLNLGTPAMPNLDMNDLPVFDVKNSPTEQAEGAKEDEHCVVPPPIPERPRPGDSFNVDETAQDPFENNKETQTQRRSKEDKRKDEFRKDLEKMLKEKEKREKNAQKREEKEKNAQKREEKEKNAQKREEKEKKASVSRKMKEDKESATDMVTKKRCEDEGDDDPGIGTMDRLRALFKFNKLNRAFDERRKKTEKETVQEENGCKEKTELLKEPEDEHLKNATKTDDMNFGPPPPLPPKPLPGSPITMITGTRLNI